MNNTEITTRRTIKFRAWAKVNKTMYANVRVGGGVESTVPSWLSPDRGWVDLWGSNEDGVVMQWTGLHDKNGKEIYEGDIVYYRPYRGEVVWRGSDYAGFAIKCSDEKGVFYFYVSRTGDEHEILPEVIGNVYETPELLKS